jgi:hypothetical protein
VTKSELKAYVAKHQEDISVLEVTDADDIMRKFDTDGSGNLDDEEMSAMKSYIQDKKTQLASQRAAEEEESKNATRASSNQRGKSQDEHKSSIHADAEQHSASVGAGAVHGGDFVTQMAFKNVSLI